MNRKRKTPSKNPRNKHVHKSHNEQLDYYKFIKEADSEPTLEQKVDFSPTDQSEKWTAASKIPPKPQKRPKTVGKICAEYWPHVVFPIVAVALVWLLIDGKVFDARADERIKNNKEDIADVTESIKKVSDESKENIENGIEKITKSIKEIDKKNQVHNTKIGQINTNITNIGKDISEIKKDVRELRSVNNNKSRKN